MSSNPYESPDGTGKPLPQGRPSQSGWLWKFWAVVAVVGVAVALFLPSVRTAGPAARRLSCQNNLKQLALALSNYEAVYHAFPPAYTTDAEGNPLHSWRTLILPFNEQQPLYDTIDLSKPWDDPANKEAYETAVLTFLCPSVVCPKGHTTYLAVVAEEGCFRATEPRKLAEITDDHQLTLAVVEVDAKRAVHWMEPTDVDQQWLLELSTLDSLPHPGGIQAACVGGDVLFLESSVRASRVRALISIDGDDDEAAEESD